MVELCLFGGNMIVSKINDFGEPDKIDLLQLAFS